jgi:hypothetical protein
MMTYKKIGEYMIAEPFRPFRIRMTSGQHYDIHHPEMILVGKAATKVYMATEPDAPERWHDLSNLLIESLEPLEAPVSR